VGGCAVFVTGASTGRYVPLNYLPGICPIDHPSLTAKKESCSGEGSNPPFTHSSFSSLPPPAGSFASPAHHKHRIHLLCEIPRFFMPSTFSWPSIAVYVACRGAAIVQPPGRVNSFRVCASEQRSDPQSASNQPQLTIGGYNTRDDD
jgi:hypothetical protein